MTNKTNNKVFLCTNGCGRRKLDTTKLKRYFRLNQCEITSLPARADYLIFVSCSFTRQRKAESLNIVKKLQKQKGELIVLGCLPEIGKKELEKIFDGKHLPTKEIDRIDEFFEDFQIKYSDLPDANSNFLSLASLKLIFLSQRQRTLQFLKNFFPVVTQDLTDIIKRKLGFGKDVFRLRVARGCNANCAYCAIQSAIGEFRSKDPDTCIKEYEEGQQEGYTNYVILGDDVGAYGLDLDRSLPELLNKLESATTEKNTTWHLKELNPAWAVKYESQLKPFFEKGRISQMLCGIQSGSERILKLMNRYPDTDKVRETFQKFKEWSPTLSTTAFVIVGFPSETQDDFQQTLELVKQCEFDNVHLFPYSDIKGTEAFRMENKIPEEIKKQRVDAAMKFFKHNKIKCKAEQA